PRKRAFTSHPANLFFPLNLSALSPTLIESELFGHKRGAFTGAMSDRQGWLAACPNHGSVFLDEIGELDPALQVKLLRVLQSRTFEPMGSTDTHRFDGKIIAATHRDLPAEMHAGRFRTDFFYRLCSDVITMPTLRQQLDADPADGPRLLRFIAERLVGPDAAPELADEVHRWITSNLPDTYPWPGNVRELEQCLRNVLVRGHYAPPRTHDPPSPAVPDLFRDARGDFIDVQTLLDRYCLLVYEREGNFQAAARRLGLDRRTVASHVRRASR
ncbi:MAG: sigma-54-dependent Fis family transcriptional regulator, partial [Phycisphaeraceae bacterium]|nr:sigma-54-dependent Fis family transcriptional regulator [Phycisphaeraceae bacterium]